MSRCLLVLLPLILAVAAPPAYAEGWIDRLRNDYGNAKASALETLAKPETVDRLASRGREFERMCEVVWTFAPYVVRTHPKAGLAALEALETHARARADAAGSEDGDKVAAAWSTLAACRARWAAGQHDAQPAWAEAAGVLRSFAGTSPDLHVRAATSYAEAAAGKGADAEALLAQGQEAMAKAIELTADEEQKMLLEAGWQVDLARTHLARQKKGPAKACVAAGIARLGDAMAGAAPAQAVLDVHYDLALLDLEHKLKVKGATMRTKTVAIPGAGLAIDLPLGSRWQSVEPRAPAVFSLYQRIPGGASLRSLTLDGWPKGQTLSLADGSVIATENTKAFATKLVELYDDSSNLADVESISKPKKVRLHKSLADGYGFVAEGTVRKTQRWARQHIVLFKGKKSKRTHRIILYEYDRGGAGRIAYEAVLKSLRVPR